MVNVSFKYKNFLSNRLNEIVTDTKTLVLRVYSSMVTRSFRVYLLVFFLFLVGFFFVAYLLVFKR